MVNSVEGRGSFPENYRACTQGNSKPGHAFASNVRQPETRARREPDKEQPPFGDTDIATLNLGRRFEQGDPHWSSADLERSEGSHHRRLLFR